MSIFMGVDLKRNLVCHLKAKVIINYVFQEWKNYVLVGKQPGVYNSYVGKVIGFSYE